MSQSIRRNFFRAAVLAAGCTLVALAAPAQAEQSATVELHKKLRPLYEAVRADKQLLAQDPGHSGRMNDAAAMDRFLKLMPLSPLEYLQMDMEARHYEQMVPSFIVDAHHRWIELNEKTAREQYGDDYVDVALTRWPVDTGADVVDYTDALRATVGTNRNAGSTAPSAPTGYDGEIQIAVNHRNTNQMVAAANTWNTTLAACNNNQTQSVFYSSDGGATWNVTCAPSNNVMALGTCSGTVFGSDPALYWNDNNEVFLNYMLLCSTTTSTQYSMVVARSANGGATWVKQGVIKNSWGTGTLEDKNFYVIDNTAASPFYGRHYTCWDRANNEKFAYSTNNGVTWTEVDLPTAPVGGVDLACEIAVSKNGTVHVVFDSLTCGASTCSDERMWYTRSTNGGVSWSSPVQVRDFNLVGFSGANKPPVADNRGISPFGAIDVDNSGGACDGTLYATFSDWASGGATETDVWVSRSTNNGATWGAPVKVNDDGLAARTQFHPFLQVDQSNGSVVVVWHDARNDANNRRVDYYASRSTNCGVSFEANTKVSQNSTEFNNSGISYTVENTTENPNRNPNQFGEYLGLDVKNGKAYMAWVDSRHFHPGSATNAQKENVGFAVIDFGAAPTPVCGNNLREGTETCDGSDLAGQSCTSQGFTGGTLSCNASCSAFVTTSCTNTVPPTTVTFYSVAAQDGRIWESGETGNVGGGGNSTDNLTTAIRVGDTNVDEQYKSIVSFDTSSIPDGATITAATLRLVRGTLSGTNPFTTHGSCVADIVSGGFGGSTAFAIGDWQAAATATNVATMSNPTTNGAASTGTLSATGRAAINKTGTTQLRIYFTLDDNDDLGYDYIGFYPGETATQANRPQLIVTYQ